MNADIDHCQMCRTQEKTRDHPMTSTVVTIRARSITQTTPMAISPVAVLKGTFLCIFLTRLKCSVPVLIGACCVDGQIEEIDKAKDMVWVC